MNLRSRLGQAPPAAPSRSGVATLRGELPAIPTWMEIAGGAFMVAAGVVALAGMVWGGW